MKRAAACIALLSLASSSFAQLPDALAHLKTQAEREPQNGSAWFRLGDAYLAANQPEAAAPAFQQARQLGFQPPVSAERIVRAWIAANKPNEALQQLERMAQGGFSYAALVENDAALAPIRGEARYTAALTRIRLNATPCEAFDQFKQLDFWLGDWAVYSPDNRLVGINKVEKLLSGCLIIEHWTGADGIVGKSMNFYDRSQRQWRQVWVGAEGNPVFVAGGIQPDESMRLSGTGRNTKGDFQRRMTLAKLETGGVRQLWEQSRDGAAWSTIFDGTYKMRTNESLTAKPQSACAASPYRQFDFWIGEWEVGTASGPGPNAARSSIQNIVDGCVIFENWMPPGGGDGKSFNFYDPNDGKWHQIWVASGAGVLDLAGTFAAKTLRYEGAVGGPTGTKTLQKLNFTELEDGRVHQHWEQSADEGKTWTVAFDGYYAKRN